MASRSSDEYFQRLLWEEYKKAKESLEILRDLERTLLAKQKIELEIQELKAKLQMEILKQKLELEIQKMLAFENLSKVDTGKWINAK